MDVKIREVEPEFIRHEISMTIKIDINNEEDLKRLKKLKINEGRCCSTSAFCDECPLRDNCGTDEFRNYILSKIDLDVFFKEK